MTGKFCCSSLFCTLLVFLIPAFLSGCGEDKKPKVIHSCQVFSEAEIRKLIDGSVEWPPKETHREDRDNGHWMSMCNYFSAETGLSASLMIQPFFPHSISAEAALESYRKSMKESLPDHELKELGSTGSPMLWNAEMGQFTYFEDKHMVLITVGKKDMREEAKLSLCRKFSEAVAAKNILKE